MQYAEASARFYHLVFRIYKEVNQHSILELYREIQFL